MKTSVINTNLQNHAVTIFLCFTPIRSTEYLKSEWIGNFQSFQFCKVFFKMKRFYVSILNNLLAFIFVYIMSIIQYQAITFPLPLYVLRNPLFSLRCKRKSGRRRTKWFPVYSTGENKLLSVRNYRNTFRVHGSIKLNVIFGLDSLLQDVIFMQRFK